MRGIWSGHSNPQVIRYKFDDQTTNSAVNKFSYGCTQTTQRVLKGSAVLNAQISRDPPRWDRAGPRSGAGMVVRIIIVCVYPNNRVPLLVDDGIAICLPEDSQRTAVPSMSDHTRITGPPVSPQWYPIGCWLAQELSAKVVSRDEETQSVCPGVNTRSIWSSCTSVCTIWYVQSCWSNWFLEFGVEHKVSLDGLSEKECEDAIEKLIKHETSAWNVL
jgi:hypothetical protein